MTKTTTTPATCTDDANNRPLTQNEIDAVAGGTVTLGCVPIFVFDGTTVVVISPTLGPLGQYGPFGSPRPF